MPPQVAKFDSPASSRVQFPETTSPVAVHELTPCPRGGGEVSTATVKRRRKRARQRRLNTLNRLSLLHQMAGEAMFTTAPEDLAAIIAVEPEHVAEAWPHWLAIAFAETPEEHAAAAEKVLREYVGPFPQDAGGRG